MTNFAEINYLVFIICQALLMFIGIRVAFALSGYTSHRRRFAGTKVVLFRGLVHYSDGVFGRGLSRSPEFFSVISSENGIF